MTLESLSLDNPSMRLRLAVGISCLPLIVPACFSTTVDDVPGETPTMDAAAGQDAEPGTDATMTTPMDAGVPETSRPDDVVVPDAAMVPTAVTVVVVNDRGPEPGVAVVFQDATGAVASTAVTDATGKASATAIAGGQVTAAFGSGLNLQLATIEGVAAGDMLTMYDATDTTLANAVVSLDSMPDISGLPDTTYNFILNVGPCYTSFAAGELPTTINLSPDCENRGRFPILVQAMSGDPSAEVAYAYQDGNTVSGDGGVTHVSMNGTWSLAAPAQTVSVTNFDWNNQTGFATYSEIADGVSFGVPAHLSSDTGSASSSYPTHPGYPASVQSEANVSVYGVGGGFASVISAIATRSTPSGDGGTTNFDLSTLLPLLDAANLDATQPARPSVTWSTEAGSLAGASGTIVRISWSQLPDGGTDYVQTTWTILAPPTATSVKAPALPASLAAWTPTDPSGFQTQPTVIVVDGLDSFLPDYAHLRASFSALPAQSSLLYDNPALDSVIPPLPADGTVRISAVTPAGG